MARTIKSISELQKLLEQKLALALKITQQEIFEVIQKHINGYYNEPVFRRGSTVPIMYNRTMQFLNSLIKTSVETSGGNVSCKVKIDMDTLHYLQPPETVVNMINEGLHANPDLRGGGYDPPRVIPAMSHFWDDAIAELGGEAGIYARMKSNCERVGIPLK